jgi:hypothetical protein
MGGVHLVRKRDAEGVLEGRLQRRLGEFVLQGQVAVDLGQAEIRR